MLSRTADHLYWMARYMERAENLARILDVTYRMSLMPQFAAQAQHTWSAALRIMAQEDAFQGLYPETSADNVLAFMILDSRNPNSVQNCLRLARENAHAVRGTLTSELWETTNSTWLKMQPFTLAQILDEGVSSFFDWVKFRSHLSRGVTLGTMLQDEALRFIRLGTFLERADNTLRILDVRYQLLKPVREGDTMAGDAEHWSALLRSLSAFEVYRRVYREPMCPARVAELLLLRVDMPRSLARCVKEVFSNLQAIANGHSAETLRRAGLMEASLRFGCIDDIVAGGLHDYVVNALAQIQALSQRISEDFLLPPNAPADAVLSQ